ncbi:helix-turn-helix domain-containing protein [Paenibacillus solisilvae]|uniref:Helix-turn-helix domain-containing protein n=1 Tax=Paenibacillus solisilvae TaxID=2486751 RepID=A0ABW0VQ71_9BACL
MKERKGVFKYPAVTGALAGTIVYPPGGRYGPRVQQDVQLVLLHTGSLLVEVDGKKRTVQPGTAALLKPGHKETFLFADKQETWHRWISVHISPMSDEEREFIDKLPLSIPISEELNRLTDLMLALQHHHSSESDLLRSLGVSALLLYASEQSRRRELQDTHPSVLLAKQTIQTRFAEELTLDLLAHESGISPEHLVRLFRTSENTTPIKYVWHYRVLRALELLTHTGLTITEIASRCGFKTTYHFARMVKEQTGRTPTEIRNSSWTGSGSGEVIR